MSLLDRMTRKRTAFLVLIAIATLTVLSNAACRSAHPARNPVGETFPTVVGRSLAGADVVLPPSEPCVLLIGYVQEAQFDADRWLYGILQADLGLRVYELPTIPGLIPSLASKWIDSGMRAGIPSEDWSTVVTVYGSKAEPIAVFTGNEATRNIRVLLLDARGRLQWMHDRGFSAGKLLELAGAARALRSDGTGHSGS